MAYDGKSGKLSCEHCGTLLTVEEYERVRKQMAEDGYQEKETAGRDDTMAMRIYHCPSCGAELMTDENTTALICTFCGNPGLIADRMSGVQRPKFVLPFCITKEQAVERFRKWTRHGLLTPSDFTSQQTIEKITGMYVPYWLYDYHVNVNLQARATRTRAMRRGDTEYIYTDHFAVFRNMEVEFDRVPADASKGMDDGVMESIEPYQYQELKPFEMGYLSGYLAEKYNMPSHELEGRVKERVKAAAVGMTRNTINQYETVNVTDAQVSFQEKKVEYAMLPVWVLNYRYRDKNYSFTLNGQTGKINGQLPISGGKVVMWFGIVTAASFVISMAVTIIGGLV
jgi:DNA-directed RNA polymerase subunit RPC12/RpoP